MQGRRLADVELGDLPEGCDEPGTYWKYVNRDGSAAKPPEGVHGREGNLTQTVWGYHSPDGGGIGTLMIHTVREEEDGTISVRPNDGSSNSILHHESRRREGHGYIEHSVGQEV